MITEAVKEETKAVLAAIDASGIDPRRKSSLRKMLVRAEEGTNGLTPEQKLQTVSESVFDLCLLQVFDMIDADKAGRGRTGLYGMIRECKWAIVALAAIVCGMLAFRPELAGLIGTLAGK